MNTARTAGLLQVGTTSTPFFLLTLLCVFGLSSCAARPSTVHEKVEGKWFVHFNHKDIGEARTILEFHTESNTFAAHSRKNADRDILGGWTSLLGRTFTKSLKNGCLIRVESGIFKEVNDTIRFAGILVTPMGRYNMDGYIANDSLASTLSNKSRGAMGSVSGNRHVPKVPMEDYPKIFQDAVKLTEAKLFNRDILQSKEWKKFAKQMEATAPKLQDDLEMVFAFFYRADKLPFSHYALMKPMAKEADPGQPAPPEKYLTLEAKSDDTAYLRISSFGGAAAEVDSIFDLIHQWGYSNLIVDLRNNSGGSVEAGMAFATRVVDHEVYGGVFLTQKWFNKNGAIPTPDEYDQFSDFSDANFDLIIEGIHETEGLCLKIIPEEEVYRGKLYILTNGRTASTCEPIVYELQRQGRATVIGETTAGAMLNGEMFDLGAGFKMVIPTADYYTSDGFRIDQNGVKPDIETKSEDALEVAMDEVWE